MAADERGLLSDVLSRVAQTGRMLFARERQDGDGFDALFQRLLGDRGEASGMAAALFLLDRYEALGDSEKLAFFEDLSARYSAPDDRVREAIVHWQSGDPDAARRLHLACEPQSQEIIRALNRAPRATPRLVRMRADLLKFLREAPNLAGLDGDFQHLFKSWFNRGFLELRRIDWTTPAETLERIIDYEAVHEIAGWDDLRRRVAESDRRLYGFFHPSMPSDPLIFVEVALTEEIPGAIGAILEEAREAIAAEEAKVAVFYSISNCQAGLRGISFGNFLIKQVVAQLSRDLPGLVTFVTLSPVPGLRKWAATWMEDGAAVPEDVAALAAHYLIDETRDDGQVRDPVAHFHLSNGAELHRVHTEADLSPRGQENSWGVMVNYLYNGSQIEANHEAYVRNGRIAASAEVRKLATVARKKRK